jgi:hypothetical protein
MATVETSASREQQHKRRNAENYGERARAGDQHRTSVTESLAKEERSPCTTNSTADNRHTQSLLILFEIQRAAARSVLQKMLRHAWGAIVCD